MFKACSGTRYSICPIAPKNPLILATVLGVSNIIREIHHRISSDDPLLSVMNLLKFFISISFSRRVSFYQLFSSTSSTGEEFGFTCKISWSVPVDSFCKSSHVFTFFDIGNPFAPIRSAMILSLC